MKTKKTDAPTVLPLSDFDAMKQPDRVALFAQKDTAASRIFIELGKLFICIEAGLGKTQTIFGVLQKAGVRKGSISNASQTARVFKELVLPGHATEGEFDALTWADVCAINRAMSGASKRKLSAPEVVTLIRSVPQNYDEELESIFASGFTIAEADAQAAALATANAKAEQDAKAETDRKAAEKAEQEKQAAIAAALQKEREQAAAAPETNPPPAAAAVPPATESPTPEPNSPPTDTQPASSEPAPVNVVTMPPVESADPDADLTDILTTIDELVVAASGMSLAAKKAVFAKLNEAMGFLAESIEEPAAA